ncbi:MAG TPA: nuclear transport factor 2 family protein [Noviherbaspirillum sp.]|nr:nuclear transport factor 2 family protein [Noviherbaspirillum sp.]
MNDHQAVLEAVDAYCMGVYRGDTGLLKSVFHPKAALFAEVRGQPYYKPLDEYLAVVANRKSPEALGEPFLMKPLAVEVTHEIAFAKLHCPMLGFNYTDYLSFVREDGRWVIVNKLFTDVPK